MANNNDNPNNNPHIKIVVTDDPSIMECIPPQLREMIQRDLGGGGIPPKQDKQEEPEPEQPKEKIKFDFGMVNCNQDLKDLTKKLKSSKQTNYGILLYGESGSGKSYYGQYLAQELGMPIIKRRASDLIDKWVGATEKNIKDAFMEAKQKKAVLLFDEADSFLFDRKYAQRDFECASTNELLTQMEDHPYPFIMTTNLKEKIDKASLRRFLFKIKYDYMTEKNVVSGVKTYFGKEFELTKEQLSKLKYITAGDFKIAKRKMDVLEDGKYTNKKIYEYLLAEQDEKDIKTSESISL
jgi:SpoVK/Ycf46/Vps4 family AAA+-type ATPase